MQFREQFPSHFPLFKAGDRGYRKPVKNGNAEKAAPARIAQLDGLRGIAVALVVMFHYSYGIWYLPVIGAIVSRAWVGVDLFFVMSGFLIGGIVIANKNADNLYSVFYFRRFLRIFPLYYLLLAVVAISVWVGWMPGPEHGSLLLYAVYLQNIPIMLTHDYGMIWLQPTWSLAIEEHFYLVLPLLVVLTPPRFLKSILVSGILLAIFMRCLGYLIPVAYPHDFGYYFTLCRVDELFYGVLLACLIRDKDPSGSGRAWTAWCYAGAIVFGLGFLIVSHLDVYHFSKELLLITVGMSFLGPFFFCVVALSILHERGLVALITKARPLRWLGIHTYAIYLFHIPAVESVNAFFKLHAINPHGCTYPLAIALTLVCATASWHLIEAPLIQRGHRVRYGKGSERPVLSAEVPLPISDRQPG